MRMHPAYEQLIDKAQSFRWATKSRRLREPQVSAGPRFIDCCQKITACPDKVPRFHRVTISLRLASRATKSAIRGTEFS